MDNYNGINKRAGTASYMTTGGVKITISRDSKQLTGNLKLEREAGMNLMQYDFNNPSVISEESVRGNGLRSQTTDRGPSRKIKSGGRMFALVSSHQKNRPIPNKNPVESSGEFDVIHD